MSKVLVVFRRELRSYFATPLAYVFIVIFLVLAAVFTFQVGGFFERGQADLQSFFRWHPWLYLVLIPAISMRLWAEERNSGSIELLMTLPLTLWQAVLGKFLAAWCFAGIALALTFPYLDHGQLFGLTRITAPSWRPTSAVCLMAGGFLSIGMCLSAATRNQVVAFITAALVGFVFLLAGFPLVLDFVRGVLPQSMVDAIASLSFFTHFEAISKGVIDLRDSGVFRRAYQLLVGGHGVGARHEKGGIVNESRWRKMAFGIGGLIALAVLFLGRRDALERGTSRHARGSHAKPALHLEPGHPAGALSESEGAGEFVFLFLARGRRQAGAPGDAVCQSGARVPGGAFGTRRRQDSLARDRSAAVLG